MPTDTFKVFTKQLSGRHLDGRNEKKDGAPRVIHAKCPLRASQFNAKYSNLKTTLSRSSGEGWKNDTRRGGEVVAGGGGGNHG